MDLSVSKKTYLEALLTKRKDPKINKESSVLIIKNKKKRKRKPKRSKISIDILPAEIIQYIIDFLDDEAFADFGSTSKRYYDFLDQYRSDRCTQDVHDSLHFCTHEVMKMYPIYRVPSRFEKDGNPSDGLWICDDDVKCTRVGVFHQIRCKFIKFSRDIDILSAYVDGELVGER